MCSSDKRGACQTSLLVLHINIRQLISIMETKIYRYPIHKEAFNVFENHILLKMIMVHTGS